MSIPTIPEVIQYGDISTYLCLNDVASGALFGKKISAPTSPEKIAMVTDALRFGYATNPNDTTLRSVANYALWEYGKYGMQARQIAGSAGGTVNISGFSAFTPYFINITSADFANATEYNNPDIVGRDIEIFAYYIPDYLVKDVDYERTATGFRMLLPTDFDATTTDYRFIVWIQGALTTTSGGGSTSDSPVTVTVNGLSGVYQFLTEKLLTAMVIQCPQNQDILIGTSLHGSDIFNDTVLANTPYTVGLNAFIPAGTILYFEVINNVSFDADWTTKLYVE